MKIKKLNINTPNLSEQVKFYARIMELEVVEQTKEYATFQLGESTLTLTQDENVKPYHFAINIPSNKEEEALAWLKERVQVEQNNNIELHTFASWNARAIYFYDRDNNIVEFIARKNLLLEDNKPFSASSLIEISEIGVPVHDIERLYYSIKEIVDLPIYSGSFDRFLTLGDERGLFVCINKEVKTWFPTGDKAYSSGFEITLKEKGVTKELKFISGEVYEN